MYHRDVLWENFQKKVLISENPNFPLTKKYNFCCILKCMIPHQAILYIYSISQIVNTYTTVYL